MSSQMPPPALPPSTGLTRTRSLRRPQIGVSAVTSSMAPPSLAARKLPSPSKQLPTPGSIGMAATRTASATMTAAPGPTMNSRISSGVMPGRLRRTATISASTTTTTMAPRMANTSPNRSASTRSMATRTTATSTASSSASTTATSASSRYYPPSTSAVLRRPNSSDEPSSPTTALPGPAVPNGRLTRTATLPSTRSSGGAGGFHARTRSTTVTRGPSPLSTVSTTTTMTSKMSKPAKTAKTAKAAKAAKTAPSATVLTPATVLRPPSAESSSASSSTTTATTTTNASTSASRKSRTTPPASASASTTARTVGPSASLHRRPRSATVGSTSAPSSSASVSASASTSSSRPAFSTLQQHYSPAKSLAPKPRTAAILAPPSPSKRPANVALSAETARLQTVLLQLHLLHRDSAATTAAWHASARELLGRRFAALVAADAELARAAAVQAERVNAAALRRWTGGGNHSLDENVQALDEVLAGVWSLAVGAGMVDSSDHHHGYKNNNNNSSSNSSSSNRYGRVVRRFERWAERTAALVEARRQAVKSLEEGDQSADDEDDDDDGSSLLLLLPGEGHKDPALVLDAAWHADCANLTRKLEGWQRQLDMLGDGDMVGGGGSGGCKVDGDGDGENNKNAASSLSRILGGCRRLVDDMLAELNVMQQLEQDAAEQELAWIRRMNSALEGSDSINSIRAAPRAGAVWRVM